MIEFKYTPVKRNKDECDEWFEKIMADTHISIERLNGILKRIAGENYENTKIHGYRSRSTTRPK